MSNEYVLWIATAAYAVHILEEYQLNWRGWARSVLRLPVEWYDFYRVWGCVASGILGTVLMAYPIVLLKIKPLRTFQYAARTPPANEPGIRADHGSITRSEATA